MLYTLVSMVQKNRYFFIPFMAWMIFGGILLSFYPKETLFLAVNGLHNPVADVLSTIATYFGDGQTYGVILFILLVRRHRRHFLIGASVLALVTLLVVSGKHLFGGPRPITFFTDHSLLHIVSWMPPHAWNSFPSGHTSTAFGLCCFLAIWWNKKQMGLLLFFFALAAAHSRMYLCQHFFADVYAGSIIGTFSCVFIYGLFELGKTGTGRTSPPRETVITPSAGVA